MEAWKATKRYFHLFEQADEDRSEVERQSRRKLGLRQGFFTLAKSRTSSVRSLSRRRTDDLEKGGNGRGSSRGRRSTSGRTLTGGSGGDNNSPVSSGGFDEKNRINENRRNGNIQPNTQGRTPEQQV